ncbi:MAG: PaaI family thioesterase [Dehalococcoidia bacterium]
MTAEPPIEPAESRADALARLREALTRPIDQLLANDAPDDIVRFTADRAESFAAMIGGEPPGRVLWGYVTARDATARGQFVIGLAAGGRPPGEISVIGDHAHGVVQFDSAFEGPDGGVHGGYLAFLFDEALSVVKAFITGGPIVTRSLSVRYHRLTPLNIPLDVRSEVTATDGRRVTVHGTLTFGDILLAEADAVFVRRRPPPVSDEDP